MINIRQIWDNFVNRQTKPLPVAKEVKVTNVWPLQKDCLSIDGTPGDWGSAWYKANIVDVTCPWLLNMDGQKVTSIQINKRCAESLARVLNNIWEAVGKDQSAIETLHYHLYSGSFNYRPMRGGVSLSMHAFGRAVDFDSEENTQHSMKHLYQENSLIVVKFKEEGWVWGGDWSPASIDAMHFQAARVHP